MGRKKKNRGQKSVGFALTDPNTLLWISGW
jgi:hypothetical protein